MPPKRTQKPRKPRGPPNLKAALAKLSAPAMGYDDVASLALSLLSDLDSTTPKELPAAIRGKVDLLTLLVTTIKARKAEAAPQTSKSDELLEILKAVSQCP